MLAFEIATALCVVTELVLLFLQFFFLLVFASLLFFRQACNAFIEVMRGGELRVFVCRTSFSHCMLVCLRLHPLLLLTVLHRRSFPDE